MYKNSSMYARLGNSCMTSESCLVSNQKFLQVDDPVYSLVLTKTQQYPGPQDYWRDEVMRREKGDKGEIIEESNEDNSGYKKKKGCC
jgi:hypothetical protein